MEYSKTLFKDRLYKKYIASPYWWKKAAEIKLNHEGYCQGCGKFFGNLLEVHHKRYTNLFNEPESDLMCVCKNCHQLLHTKH